MDKMPPSEGGDRGSIPLEGVMRLEKTVCLAPFSTFKIGGKAEYFLSVQKPDDLIAAIEFAKKRKISYKIFAGGSNVLFPDDKIKGLVIRFLGGRFRWAGKNKLLIDGGVPLEDIVKESINLGWRGLETLSGIPGTIGGAIIGNAGAYGHSISEIVDKVEVWDPLGVAQGKGKLRTLRKSDCKFRYRESIFKRKPYFLLRAVLKFKKGNKKELKKISQEVIKLRAKKYNSKIHCPGSFFKNVLIKDISKKFLKNIDRDKIKGGKIPSGYLLEEVGAKGMRIGRIQVADHHGNLIMNKGGGKASDVKKLAAILKKRVKNRLGIELEEEVRYF